MTEGSFREELFVDGYLNALDPTRVVYWVYKRHVFEQMAWLQAWN